MQEFIYPAVLTPDEEDGGFVVGFVDFPEAITQGEAVGEALREASDCIEEAIANRLVMGLPVPKPSRIEEGQYAVPVPAQTAAKAALYVAVREAGISKMELARRLHCDEKEVRRLLDPRHSSKLSRLESAIAAVGQKLVVGLQAAV